MSFSNIFEALQVHEEAKNEGIDIGSSKTLALDLETKVSKHEESIHSRTKSTTPLDEEGEEEAKAKEALEEEEVKGDLEAEVEVSLPFEKETLSFVEALKQEHHPSPPLTRVRKSRRNQRKKEANSNILKGN